LSEKVEHVDEEDKRIEEEMKKFKEHLENKYGVTTEDIMKRLEDLNHKLDQVIDTVGTIKEKMVTKEALRLEIKEEEE